MDMACAVTLHRDGGGAVSNMTVFVLVGSCWLVWWSVSITGHQAFTVNGNISDIEFVVHLCQEGLADLQIHGVVSKFLITQSLDIVLLTRIELLHTI